MLKYGKYLKCLFNSFLSQLSGNSVFFLLFILKLGLLIFKRFWKFFVRGPAENLSNHRSYYASVCMPLIAVIGPLMTNFLSVVIYFFHLRERAPFELEGSFCHKNYPSNYIIRQLDTGSCSKRTEIALKQ